MKNALMITLVVVIACLFLGGNGQLLEQDCGATPQSLARPRIFGGQDAKMKSNPWMAHLIGMYGFFCGGSLINNRFVLTAAHCIESNVYFIVRLGEYDTRTAVDCRENCAAPHQDYAVESTYKHPYYRTFHYYDIALIKLQRNVEFTENIRPICILLDRTLRQRMDNLREYTLTGWGLMPNGQPASVLQTANVTQIDRYTCARRTGYRLDQTHICAGNSRTHGCQGDSGGPLGTTVRYNRKPHYVQFGIVSYGNSPCNGVSVFTNVLAYTPWIQSVISDTQELLFRAAAR